MRLCAVIAASVLVAGASWGQANKQGGNDAEWPLPGKNYANTRFSNLNQINTGNVQNLKLAWTFATGELRGEEAAPLVVNNTMYVVTPFPNILYAITVGKGTGTLKWKFDPQPDRSAQGVACCDTVNRGAAYANGKVFWNTLDNHTVAVDAETGQQVWKTKLDDINTGSSMTMAPLVVKNVVIVGNSGGEFGVRGWLAGLDANSGKILWRAYSTGPDKDVLIGPNFKPYYQKDRGKDLGVSTWPPGAWKIGGGSSWGFVSYDPDLDLIYYGISNPGPWNSDVRPGDNKWTSGMFARRPETGEAIWAYQYNPHDDFDYDGINEHVLADLTINGKPRKVLMHPDRNGHMYVLDRTNGEVISANFYVYANTTGAMDLKTGLVSKNPAMRPATGKTVHGICPVADGGKDWQPSAFSPRTGLLYIPHNNMCMDEEYVVPNYIAGTPYVGAIPQFTAGPGGNRGEFTAWDPVAGKPVWSIKELFPAWSGAMVTAGDVVFYGTMDRWFKAVDAKTGKVLWQFQTGSGIISQPTTFLGPDGKQYIAVIDGVGGWAGAIVAGGLDPADGTGALGFVNAMKDLPNYTGRGGTVYVFGL